MPKNTLATNETSLIIANPRSSSSIRRTTRIWHTV